MFSPKALDRAFTLELSEVDLAAYGAAATPVAGDLDLSDVPDLATARRPDATDWDAFGLRLGGTLRASLVALHTRLSGHGRHFGYRVANEIARFVELAGEGHADEGGLWAAFDIAVLTKVLPKFHGTQQELGPVLEAVLVYARGDASAPRLPRTHRKVERMLLRLQHQGFTSFIE